MQAAQIHIGQSTGVSVWEVVSLLFQGSGGKSYGSVCGMKWIRIAVVCTRMMSSCLLEVRGRGEGERGGPLPE